MTTSTHHRIRDLILQTVPEDGTTIDYQSLFEELRLALEASTAFSFRLSKGHFEGMRVDRSPNNPLSSHGILTY